jgi:hypothetical protein
MAKADSERVRHIEELVRRLEDLPGESREIAQSLMEAVLELHGAGLERMMDLVFQAGDVGEATIRRFAGDDLVSNLLVLHDLHPDDIETRVQHALGKMHGDAELLGVFEGIVRVRLTAGGCGVRESVEAAIRGAVPDAAEIVISESMAPSGFVPLAALMV